MRTAQIITAVVLALVFLPLGVAKIAAVPVMRRAAAHLGMSPGFYRAVGALEVAGTAGLPAGLACLPLAAAVVAYAGLSAAA